MKHIKTLLKSKTIHGLKTGSHANPHMVAAAKRYGGGSCSFDGESKPGRMGSAPRMRAAGGRVRDEDDDDLERVEKGEAKQDMHHFKSGGRIARHKEEEDLKRVTKGQAKEDDHHFKRGGKVHKHEKNDHDEDDGYAKGGWIKNAVGKPGALHKELGVPAGDKIPMKKLDKAEHSSNPTLKKRAVLARTLRGFSKG